MYRPAGSLCAGSEVIPRLLIVSVLGKDASPSYYPVRETLEEACHCLPPVDQALANVGDLAESPRRGPCGLSSLP